MAAEELTVSDLITLLWRSKGLVIGLVVTGVVIGGAFTYFSTARWQAKTTLLLPLPDSTSGSAAANFGALIGQGSANPLDILEGVLKSREATEAVAKKAGADPDAVNECLKVNGDSPTNQLVITFESPNQEQGLAVVGAAAQELGKLAKSLGISVASRTRVQIEEALKSKNRELETAEARLTAFLQKAKTVPDPATPYSAVGYLKAYSDAEIELGKVTKQLSIVRAQAGQAYASPVEVPKATPEADQWRTQLIERETQLQLTRVHFGDMSPQVISLKEEVEVLKRQIRTEMTRKMQAVNASVEPKVAELEASRQMLQWQVDTLKLLADKAPQEAAQLMRLQREVLTLTEVVAQLRSQYEKVKLDADVEKIRWSVLEAPYIVKPAVNKRYGRAGAVGGGLGLFLGALAVLWRRGQSQA